MGYRNLIRNLTGPCFLHHFYCHYFLFSFFLFISFFCLVCLYLPLPPLIPVLPTISATHIHISSVSSQKRPDLPLISSINGISSFSENRFLPFYYSWPRQSSREKKGPEIQKQSEIASDPTVRSPIKRPSNTAVTDMQRVKVSPVQFPG